MSNEEKIKAFLSDKENIKSLINDGKFMDAVSGGNITTEVIAEKFKELGLPLSDSEAREVKNATEKALAISPEKLENIELQKISGGTNQSTVFDGALMAASAGAISATGCLIAGIVYNAKASDALRNCDWGKYKKFDKAAKGLFTAAGVCLGITIGGLIGGKFAHRFEPSRKE